MIKEFLTKAWRIALLVMVVAHGSCRQDEGANSTLSVSIAPQRALLQQIAGDKWDIECVLENGSDPESFDPSMSTIKNLMRSRAYFTIGHLPFEHSLLDKVGEGNTAMMIVDTSNGVDFIEGTHGEGDSHSHDIDPHTWCSVKNAKILAHNMFDALVELDPNNKDYYTENINNLTQRLDSIDSAIADKLQQQKGAAFLVWHPSLSYFARDYGLKQIALGHENKDMSVAGFKNKIDRAKADSVRLFVVQPEYDSAQSKAIATEVGAEVMMVNLMGENWLEDLVKVANSIAR